MCNYILKQGGVCAQAKTKQRCSYHSNFEKFPPNVETKSEGVEMLQKIIDMGYWDTIICPCGSKNQKRKFHKHRVIRKHKQWEDGLGNDSEINTKSFEICRQVYEGLGIVLAEQYDMVITSGGVQYI